MAPVWTTGSFEPGRGSEMEKEKNRKKRRVLSFIGRSKLNIVLA
jgi:hypothetical protein